MRETLVVKIGGGEGVNVPSICADLARITGDYRLVVVHGVSAEANALCEARGVPVRMITSPSGHSSRYTDAPTREIFVEAARNVNQTIVGELATHDVRAQLVEGSIRGTRKEAVRAVVDGRVRIVRDNYTGSITGIDEGPIRNLLTVDIVPVLPPEANSEQDGILNVDGDRAAAAVAAALKADTLIILSNVRGLYRNFPDEDSFVDTVSTAQMDSAMEWAQGRMKRKVLGAQEALEGGVRRVMIANGQIQTPVQNALNNEGTTFIR